MTRKWVLERHPNSNLHSSTVHKSQDGINRKVYQCIFKNAYDIYNEYYPMRKDGICGNMEKKLEDIMLIELV